MSFLSGIINQVEGLGLKSLQDILQSILGGLSGGGAGNILANVEHSLIQDLERIGGHTEALGVGRAIVKTIDKVYENSALTAEQKQAVAVALSQNIAAQLAVIQAAVLAYPALQGAVANAADDASRNAARGPRNNAVVAIKGEFAGLIDAAAGNVQTG